MDGVNPKKCREHFKGEPPRLAATHFEYNASSIEVSVYGVYS